MSGTSKDGVDAALVRINGSGIETDIELLHFICSPYKSDIRNRLENLSAELSLEEVSGLNFIIGNLFAKAALLVIEEAGLKTTDVDLIASHGQTIFHNPPSYNNSVPSTLQIGEIDVIAEKTGLTTVGDFRTRDIAAGGEGAPLVPYVDYILLREKGETVIAQNVGGIGNATVITENIDGVIAFDTGPGNALMDWVVNLATDGTERFDKDGARASSGMYDKQLLKKLLSDPYLQKQPPKSAGEELFGKERAQKLFFLVDRGGTGITLNDLLATLVEFTVESIALSYEKFIFPMFPEISEVIFSGGGCDNPFLMKRLEDRLHTLKCVKSDKYGLPTDAKEAIAFAILANELVSGNKSSLPRVTGASHRVPLGKIAFGR